MAQMTRRAFVQAAALGVVSLSGLSLWGCAGWGSTSPEAAGTDAGSADAPVEPDPVEALIASLSLEEKVAQLFVVRPEDMLGVYRAELQAEDEEDPVAVDEAGYFQPATAVTDQISSAVSSLSVGGFAFFGNNLEDPEQTQLFLSQLRECALAVNGVAPFLCVDEEGGSVSRVAKNEAFAVENVGEMAEVGASADPDQAKVAASQIAAYLKPLGFNVDFAPVCDVADNPENPTLAKRSFGADPAQVAAMVAAAVRGFEEADMACCLKHFPGLGSAEGDSHTARISIPDDLEGLKASELKPFQAGIAAGAPLVMMGHLSVPAVTGNDVPASLSEAMVTGVLRDQLGFDGVVITDSLGMQAVTDYYSSAEAVVAAVQAGCDVMLMPEDLQAAYDGLLGAVQNGAISEGRIDGSLRRILAVKQRYLP